jgi:hypothetical protein
MEAIRVKQTVRKKGEVTIRDLPVVEGQEVEVLLMISPANGEKRPRMTAQQLLDSPLIGLWEEREDIGDSVDFASQLREKAQNRP